MQVPTWETESEKRPPHGNTGGKGEGLVRSRPPNHWLLIILLARTEVIVEANF